jgi:tetratricopeptide (TPR) repeat protein
VAACVALLAAAFAGCAQRDRGGAPGTVGPEAACSCAPAPVVDPTLLAFLSKARAAHHQADVSLDAGDRASAIRALERIVSGPTPSLPGGPAAGLPPEVAEVTADTRARLADLRSAQGDFDAALRDIEAGLSLSPSPSHFRGHLVEVRGLVEERRAKALDDQGEREAADRARKAAVAAFQEAIVIQDEVIAEALKAAKEKPR